MNQINMFETLYEPLPIWDKPLKVCELYGGIGSQFKAWRNLGLKIQEHYLVEVDIDATISYAAMHCQLNYLLDNFNDNERFPSKQEMVKTLAPYGWWTNDKPKDIKKLKLSKLKALWLAQKLTNNFGDVFNLKGVDMPKVDIITWSTPCKDFSLAGKQKGFEGKNGGLTFVTLKLFREMKECGTLPNFLLFENVPMIISKIFIHGFNMMRKELRDLGYVNITLKMNAKNFGMPQTRDRVFILSIKKEYIEGKRYDDPKPFPLELRLKDMLQDNPEGKYNLSRMEKLMITKDGNIKRYINSDVVDEFKEGDSKKNKNSRMDLKDYVESDDGIMPTITTRADCLGIVIPVDPKYFISEKMLNYLTNESTGKYNRKEVFMRNFDEKKDVAAAILTTAGSRPVDNFIIMPEATKKGYAIAKEGDGIYLNRPNQKRGVVQKDMVSTIKTNGDDLGVIVKGNYMPSGHTASRIVDGEGIAPLVRENHGTVTAVIVNKNIKNINDENKIMSTLGTNCGSSTSSGGGVVKSNLRIRKLTPRECWRLMGFDDEDFDNASKHTTDTQLYKQAGNSIVVNVLMEIFRNLLLGGN